MSAPRDALLYAAIDSALGSEFALKRELGGGGMSRVFLAEELSLHRAVVIKVLKPELAAGVSADRFSREVRLVAQLQQANIVPLIAAGDANGFPYYTMPFVAGDSLRAMLDAVPRLPVPQVIDILVDVTKALAFAHEHGVVHRDIKPENILFSGGTAVVTDFGIAKAITMSLTGAPNDTLTQVGMSLGTAAYMSPEQAVGDTATDHRADLYALGVVGYEMLAGERPFSATSLRDLVRAHVMQTPEPVTARRPDTPPALAELIDKCLAKEPGARPENAGAMLAALRIARRQSTSRGAMGTPSAPPAALTTASRSRVSPFKIAAAAAVIVGAIAGVYAWRALR